MSIQSSRKQMVTQHHKPGALRAAIYMHSHELMRLNPIRWLRQSAIREAYIKNNIIERASLIAIKQIKWINLVQHHSVSSKIIGILHLDSGGRMESTLSSGGLQKTALQGMIQLRRGRFIHAYITSSLLVPANKSTGKDRRVN